MLQGRCNPSECRTPASCAGPSQCRNAEGVKKRPHAPTSCLRWRAHLNNLPGFVIHHRLAQEVDKVQRLINLRRGRQQCTLAGLARWQSQGLRPSSAGRRSKAPPACTDLGEIRACTAPSAACPASPCPRGTPACRQTRAWRYGCATWTWEGAGHRALMMVTRAVRVSPTDANETVRQQPRTCTRGARAPAGTPQALTPRPRSGSWALPC